MIFDRNFRQSPAFTAGSRPHVTSRDAPHRPSLAAYIKTPRSRAPSCFLLFSSYLPCWNRRAHEGTRLVTIGGIALCRTGRDLISPSGSSPAKFLLATFAFSLVCCHLGGTSRKKLSVYCEAWVACERVNRGVDGSELDTNNSHTSNITIRHQ